MRYLSLLSLIPTLAIAGPTPRQATSQRALIISATSSGPGCPSGTITTDLTTDSQTITVGFDAYQVIVGPGAPQNEREKHCDVTVRLNFPVGCTAATIKTTYHGFAQLEGGVTGIFAPQYSLSPGQLTGGNPPSAVISSAGFSNGNVYTKEDITPARVNVASVNQQNVNLVLRTRLFLQASNQTVSGTLSSDDATISITQQARC
ncbi:hypothetical protein B0T25DRAFT_496618 [Lasiosphaeria hispida]|uniref:Secreted protein n=1 Tax=Lasiosphaeria hispida TaxID=260671 RepID=A0AAJ0HSI1_9PEZI|nr:hypothetical protein B0T25DRAFT_496618 [Lasiosphaeria hispida]